MAHHIRHYGGDVYADAGFWSPSTSTANFCEEDYAISRYMAEFVNSISNLAYVYLALRRTGWHISRADQLSASLCAVGVCSFLFHASLRQWAQFSDDVSMLFLAAALLQRLCCGGGQHQPPGARAARVVTVAIYATVGGMSAAYMSTGNLLVHLSMFVAMLLLIGLRTVYLVNRQVPREKAGYLWRFGTVCACLALAFLVWNIDLEWCFELRRLRNAVGLPWALLLELHGWWHVLTALGATLHIDLVRDLCP